MKRILLILMLILTLGAAHAPDLVLTAPSGAVPGENVSVQLHAHIGGVDILNPPYVVHIETSLGRQEVPIQIEGLTHIAHFEMPSEDVTLHANVQAGPNNVTRTQVIRATPTNILPAEKVSLNTFKTLKSTSKTIYNPATPIGVRSLLPVTETETGYEYAAGYDHLVFEANTYTIVPGTSEHTFIAVERNTEVVMPPLLGVDSFVLIDANLTMYIEQPLTLEETKTITLDVPEGKYFALLTGSKNFVQPIAIVESIPEEITPEVQPEPATEPTSESEPVAIEETPIEKPKLEPTHIYNSEDEMVTAQIIERPDGENRTVEVYVPEVEATIMVHSTNDTQISIGVEHVNNSVAQEQTTAHVLDAYAVNPGFSSNYTITKTAVGRRLLKCTEYDFASQTCYGEFKEVGNITPGEVYSFTFTPEDPLFIEDGWWDVDYARCKEINITRVGADPLADYPVYVTIPLESTMQGDGDDIRFVNRGCGDGGRDYYHELEYTNATHADVWVRMNLTNATTTMAMYYDNPFATARTDTNDTWISDYLMVQHMEQDGDDSTSNDNDKQADQGTTTADNDWVGYGRLFSNNNAWSMIDNAMWESSWSERTHEMIFETGTDVSTRQTLLAEGGGTNGYMIYILSGRIYARWWSESSGWNGTSFNTTVSANTQYHIVTRFNSTGGFYDMILNGTLVDSGTPPSAVSSHSGNGGIGYTGDTKDYHDTSGSGNYFRGTITETRVLSTTPSRSWFNQTTQMILNQSGYVTFGAEQQQSPVFDSVRITPTILEINGTVVINATVTDIAGNATVLNVTATVESPNGTRRNITLMQQETGNGTLESGDVEAGTQTQQATNKTIVFGEVGSINITNGAWTLITFSNTYNKTPVIIPTTSTINNGTNNALVPLVSSVNATHANVTICQDAGSSKCTNNYGTETLDYMVFDRDRISEFNWIDTGQLDLATNGGTSSSQSFNLTFNNTPYVYAWPQTYSGGGSIGATVWTGTVTATSLTMIACDHPGAGDSCNNSFTETIAWVAIDPINQTLEELQMGTESIGGSAWTAISFSPAISPPPAMMVTVNGEAGNQDPVYPWARSITTTGADIRYCEQDGANDCDGHNPEVTRWAAHPEGSISRALSSGNDSKGAYVTYEDTLSGDAERIINVSVTVHISNYDNGGSVGKGNDNPDLELEIASSLEGGWVKMGNLSVSGTGNYTVVTTDPSILRGWKQANVRDVRVRSAGLDFFNASSIDSVSWDGIYTEIFYENVTSFWNATIENNYHIGEYNISHMYAMDDSNLTTISTFNNLTYNVTWDVNITLESPPDNETYFTQSPLNFTFNFTNDRYTTVNCEIYVDDVVLVNSTCTNATQRTEFLGIGYGNHSWFVRISDYYGNNFNSSVYNFSVLITRNFSVDKKLIPMGDNQYFIILNVSNNMNFSANTSVYDFTTEHATPYNFSMVNTTSLVTGEFEGATHTFELEIPGEDWINVTYTMNVTGNFKLADMYMFGSG